MMKNRRVAFVIEDNVELGYIYAAALEMANFKVEHLVDGKQALDRLEREVPDLVILDMNLPHVSGHYIYKKVRADERFATTPIIIATANSLIAEALGSELGEKDHLLIKPVSPSQLRNLAKTMFP
jgi:DNA-binding response OmpR family regulator